MISPSNEQSADNSLWLSCRLWMSEDCRYIQIESQLLDFRTRQAVGDVQSYQLNRVFIRWEEEQNTFFVDGKPFTPANNSPEPYIADAYIPIGPQMLLLAISQWILEIAQSTTKFVEILQVQCNAASWVRLRPTQLVEGVKMLSRENDHSIMMNVHSASCNTTVERFIDY